VSYIYGIPEGTVKSRMYHIREQMKRILREEVN
jgi:DNA-directed RNA polymerase specialized sigma24 family protein